VAMSRPIDFSYTGDIAVLYRGFLLIGHQPGYGPDEPPKLGYVRAYRNTSYFNDGIRSYESTHFHLVYDMIEEVNDTGEFTEEQFAELEGSGRIVGRMYKSIQEALGTPVYEALEEPGEYIAEVATYPPRVGIIPRLPEGARGDFLFYEYIRDLCKYEALSEEDVQELWEGYKQRHG